MTGVKASIRWLGMPELWIFFLLILPAIFLAVYSVYRRERGHLTPRRRALLVGLRTVIVLAGALIFFQPVLERTRYIVKKSVALFLFDDSSSMRRKDHYVQPERKKRIAKLAGAEEEEISKISRIDLIKRILAREESWNLKRLSGEFDLRFYGFSSSLMPDVSVANLKGSGSSTRIGDSVLAVLREFRGQSLRYIFLISDGQSNEGTSPLDAAEEAGSQGVPLILLGVGDPDEPRDVELRNLTVEEVVLVHDEVAFEVTVRQRGYEGVKLTLYLKEDGTEVAREDILLEGALKEQKVVFYHKPARSGSLLYSVEVPPLQGEHSTENNAIQKMVQVIKKRIKVLFVEGYPRWEYRYLKNALIRDEETVEAACLLLSAEEGLRGESSPDLPPIRQFPSTREELFQYDVLIFGDVNPNQLGFTSWETKAILENIDSFVGDLGGGFFMIAGQRDSPASYRGTPIETVLPVAIGEVQESWMPGTAGRFFFPLRTMDGLEDPILQLERDPEENRLLWEDEEYRLPVFDWYFPVKRAKDGAKILLVHPEERNEYGNHVILARQFYGAGRTLFCALDSLWRWRYSYGDRYFYRFYSQAIRYLAFTKLHSLDKRFKLFLDRSVCNLGDMVVLYARVLDKNFQPLQEDQFPIFYQEPGSERIEKLLLKGSPERSGTFEGYLRGAKTGLYTCWIEPEGEGDGERVSTTSFEVTIPSIENLNSSLDRETLEEMAQLSEGEFLPFDELQSIFPKLKGSEIHIPTSIYQEDLWDKWWVLVALSLLLGLEWLLRKKFRLL